LRIDGSVEPGPKEEQGADDTHTHRGGEQWVRRPHGESSQSTFRILRGKAEGAQTLARSRDLPGDGARQRAHRLRQGVEICPGMGQGRGRTDFGKE